MPGRRPDRPETGHISRAGTDPAAVRVIAPRNQNVANYISRMRTDRDLPAGTFAGLARLGEAARIGRLSLCDP